MNTPGKNFSGKQRGFTARRATPPALMPVARYDAGDEKTTGKPAREAYLRESDLVAEEAFRELLGFERKRSERSGRPLLLMLLDASGIADRDCKYSVIRHTVRALSSAGGLSAKGWYRHDMIFGAVFNGIDAGEKELREKIAGNMPPETAGQAGPLKLAFFSFPPAHQQNGKRNANQDSESLFYPEVRTRESKRRLPLFLKRALDIAGGSAGVLLFSPLFLVISLLIKSTSKGPVLFRQERIGRLGETFVFFKFRTMSVDNDPMIHRDYIKKFIQERKSYDAGRKGAIYKIKDDPRVTSVGRFLRKTSLDELPQFFNVLKGEMSLVGPRPPIPYELENYDLWHWRRIMEIKPGITGLWQVSGRSSTTFDDMVRLDLKYAREWSLWMDIKIILKTPVVILTGKGGY